MAVDVARHEALLDWVAPWSGVAPAGYQPNFLGTMTALPFMAHWYPRELLEAARVPRHVATERPRPPDGECYFEWCNVIQAALDARGRFVMVELGGGYGARSVDCAMALARLNPTKAFFVVVEALPVYLEWCRAHFRANGLAPEEHWLLNAVVSAHPVPEAMFLSPRGFGNQVADASMVDVLTQAARDATSAEALVRHLVQAGAVRFENGAALPDGSRRVPAPPFDPIRWTSEQMQGEAIVDVGHASVGFVSALTLENLLAPLDRVDFVDVDIQFAEMQVIPPNVDLLARKVKLLSIGTHAGDIHDALRGLFDPAQWELLNDFAPWSRHETTRGAFDTTDGILTLRNRRVP